MGSIREYSTIRDYVSDCDGVNFDRFNDSKDNEYYLSVAHNALEEYTGYFGQGYVEYYEGNTDQVFVSDRISGGLILNSDEVETLVSNETKKILEVIGVFIFNGDYSKELLCFFIMFLLSLALQVFVVNFNHSWSYYFIFVHISFLHNI